MVDPDSSDDSVRTSENPDSSAAALARLTTRAKCASKRHIKSAVERKVRKAATYKRYDSSPRGRFKQQKQKAKRRNIPWELSFLEWCEIWATSGKWDQRGTFTTGYVMARLGDKGPYAKGNVQIVRHLDNVAERNEQWHAKENEKPDDWYVREAEESPLESFDIGDDPPF